MEDRAMKSTCDEAETYLYDARITAIDHPNRTLEFSVAQGTHRIPVGSVTHWTLGSVGRLRLPTGSREFAFHTYADPLLRRAPGLDDPSTHRWGWRLGERRFTVEAGILPGRGGAVLRRDTEPLALDLPREFLELCEDCGLTPATVLRGFVADLCSLYNWCSCPREDNYSNNGSDERAMAKDYFRRAYGWVSDPLYAEQLLNSPSRGSPRD
jgi:hypothetical protein